MTADERKESDEHPLRLLGRRSALGLLAGLSICASLPPWGWWPLAFVGAALWYRVIDAPPRARFIISWFVGVGWFMPSTLWVWRLTAPGYLVGGLVGWAGLVGLVGLAVPRGRHRYLALSATVMVFEWFHSLAPFGGVPISMLSFSQARGPMLNIARIGGGIMVSGMIVALGCALYMAVFERRRIELMAVFIVTVILIGAGSAARLLVGPVEGNRTVRLAAVQGGGPQGNTFTWDEVPRVFQRHLDATKSIKGPVDLVVWPENTVYMVDGTFADSYWRQEIAAQARRLNAPIMVGVVEDDPDSPKRFLNYVIVVNPDGSLTGRFDKERRVPFGEYVPLRPFFELFAKGQLPSRDAIVGVGSANVDTGPADTAVAISWEIFFARRVREGVRDGGQLVLNPTNGASYWLTQVQSQQIATSTFRAIESGRWLVQVSPTGFSAIIDPEGRVHDRTAVSERAVLEADIPLMRGTLPAQLFGEMPALLMATIALTFITIRRRGFDRRDYLTGKSTREEA